jgi:predicted nucleotidyltransferase
MRTKEHELSPRNLAGVLFGAYRRKLLGLLLLSSQKSFYVREIERLTGVPAGSLHRELKLLTEAGLLQRIQKGSQIHYQVSRSCPIIDELTAIFRKTVGVADVVRDALKPLEGKIELALVFGSMASVKEDYDSDVDVLVVGDLTLQDVVEALSDAEQRLMREVNPVVMTADSFRLKRDKKDRFITRVMAEPKILLKGTLEDDTDESR